ncbi:TIGR00366 family protein [Clostridium vitabionis]|uniref:TIGR00366 family protein n=1 Tax=Clostridium vitabionis TaxID=2784388 RepID=UPI00188A59EC|nr:TIGR00366 family protein [Clostridium vitabionis]
MWRKGIKFDYPLIVAAGSAGEMCWHGGLSASIGLTIAQPSHFLEAEMGVIPFPKYLINPLNVTMLIAFAIIPPIICYFLHPKPEKCAELRPETIAIMLLSGPIFILAVTFLPV